MEERTAVRVLDEFQKTLKRAGVDFAEIAQTLAAPSHLTKEEEAEIPGTIYDMLVARLKAAPEPAPEQLSRLVAGLRTFPLCDVRNYLVERARALPTKRGGRPKLLGSQEEADLTATISERLSVGVEKMDAIRGAAAKFGVSLWTAKRAWRKFQESMEGRNEPAKPLSKRARRSKVASAHRTV
jgi:hypothetical protein